MDIPAEVQIKATLQSGSVYYFEDSSLTSTEPHYFVVINKEPLHDFLILLVCSSSQIDKVKIRNKHNPTSTLVEISPTQYADFTKDSIIDCNTVFPRSIKELINKLDEGKLKLKSTLPTTLTEQLRQGVLDSPLVESSLKRIIQ